MSHRHLSSALSRPRVVLATGAVCVLAALSACSTSSSNTAAQNPAPNGNGASTPVTNPVLAEVYKGTLSEPDATARPAAKNKKIVIISSGQSSISSSIPVNAAK